MLIDGRGFAPGVCLEPEFCLVGAGAAGITLARELGRHGASVLVLESGGLSYQAETQRLYQGTAAGDVLGQDGDGYLVASRQRYLGGTTNHWSGWCRPLDPIDFQARAWVPHSGWPFGREELDPYYPRAAEILEVPPFDYPAGALATAARPALFPAGGPVETSFFHVSPPTRFGSRYRAELGGSAAIHVATHTNLLSLDLHPDGRRVDRAVAGTLEGHRFEVRAGTYVLAAGGIENARLLLLGNQVHRDGIGNDRGLVGRFFMDHPNLPEGFLALPRRRNRMDLYFVRHEPRLEHRIQGTLRLAESQQRRLGLLNVAFLIGRPKGGDNPPLKWEIDHLAGWARHLTEARPAGDDHADFIGRTVAACEQTPDPDSRVTLGGELDDLGQRRVRLDWRIAPGDRQRILDSFTCLAAELGRRGLGRIHHPHDPERPFAGAVGSNHHMGTTRMSADPTRGVVDPDGRVHGIANLYVAGSSVFPTSGCSNPTLTIVALALRLSRHLLGRR